MTDRQLTGLTQASQHKKQIALAKTEKAIDKLSKNKQKITVRAVAREAGVSVSYIYKYPQLAYKIQTLREQQKYDTDRSKLLPSKTIKQFDKIEQEKQDLTAEIEHLKYQIEQLKKQGNSLSKLQLENIQLQTENQKLKQELAHIKKNLQETRDFILSQGYNTQEQLPDRGTD